LGSGEQAPRLHWKAVVVASHRVACHLSIAYDTTTKPDAREQTWHGAYPGCPESIWWNKKGSANPICPREIRTIAGPCSIALIDNAMTVSLNP
jgi:hypothetical protein